MAKKNNQKTILATIKALQEQNELLRKQLAQRNEPSTKKLEAPKTEAKKSKKGSKLSEKEMMDHLWLRCRNMDSKEYWWFKQMSRVVTIFGKELSEKQRESFLPIWEKYKDTKVTPKDEKNPNPHKK